MIANSASSGAMALDTMPLDMMPLDMMPLDMDAEPEPNKGISFPLDFMPLKPAAPAPAPAPAQAAAPVPLDDLPLEPAPEKTPETPPRPAISSFSARGGQRAFRPLRNFAQVEDGPSFYLSLSDLMSLLLVFFVLIFSLTTRLGAEETPAPQTAKPVLQKKAANRSPMGVARLDPMPHPQPMTKAMRLGLKGVIAGGQGDPGLKNESKPQAMAMQTRPTIDLALLSLISTSTPAPKHALPQAALSLSVLLEKVRQQVKAGPAGVEVEQGPNKLVLRLPESITFNQGQAQVLAGMQPTLKGLAQALAAGKTKSIVVTGHTDDIPISTAMYASNWELSAARAASVARALMDQGIDAGKITIQGLADQRPRMPNDTPTHRAQNRRVEIELRTKG